jgi:hypothetical protein
MYDANDTVTTSTTDRVKNVYTVTLRKLIGPTPTITAATAVKKTASSSQTITVDVPSTVQLSSNPLDGKYRVKCVDKNGGF